MIKLDLPLPWNSTQSIRVGISTNEQRSVYDYQPDGLHFAPGSSLTLLCEGLAVPVSNFQFPQMKSALAEDGLTPEILTSLLPGQRVQIEHQAGIFIGLVDSYPDLVARALLEVGGHHTTSIDNEVIFDRSLFY